ncbi:MAG: hypothetical protein R6U17_03675 [Thermoplasmata archaeon]
MKRIKHDGRGVTELPLKLLLMCALLGLLVPTAAYGYRDISRIRLQRTVEENIQNLLFEAKRVSNQGDLSQNNFQFDASGGHMARIDYIKFGGTIEGDCNVIQYKMGWWKQPMYILCEDVCITSRENETFSLNEGGIYELALTRITVSDEPIVVLSMSADYVDLDLFS